MATGLDVQYRRKKKLYRKRKFKFKRLLWFLLFYAIFSIITVPLIIIWGPFNAVKSVTVGAIYSSRHPQVIKAFLSEEQINAIIHKFDNVSSNDFERQAISSDASSGITIEDIKGRTFQGKVMLITDPKRVKVAVTKYSGVKGERISDYVNEMGAIAGINGGGFDDPQGTGSGETPLGLTVHNGEIVKYSDSDMPTIALDKNGKLSVETLSPDDVKKKDIVEALSFWPVLIKDGEKGKYDNGYWSIAPRSAIGQKADGTIIFVVINGRQMSSIGAQMDDLYKIFHEYGAINAVNLDGGSSAEMFYDGKVINQLWDSFGERYLPTAFVVMPNKE
ncbi:phosphodiester glycosidase family protein [Desulfitobacterium sp. AusDCA]|uniref:phosphodiester glycosidase family protein n=1 Tax=Desulfitobacterium sp. AusDCA TaxID=3240383 RepID=UPI003DA6FC9D